MLDLRRHIRSGFCSAELHVGARETQTHFTLKYNFKNVPVPES